MGPFPLIYSKKKEYLLTVKKVLSLYQVFVFMEQNNTYFCALTRLISYQFIVSVVWVELSWMILLLFFVVSSVDVIMLGFGYMWVVQKWPQLFINGVVCQLSISLAGSLILMVAKQDLHIWRTQNLRGEKMEFYKKVCRSPASFLPWYIGEYKPKFQPRVKEKGNGFHPWWEEWQGRVIKEHCIYCCKQSPPKKIY